MRILFSVENFYPRLGGGEVFIDELAEELRTRGNEVYITYVGERKPGSAINLLPKSRSYSFKNITLFNRSVVRLYFANLRWKRHLNRLIRKIKPELIITQLEYTPSSVEAAKAHGVPCIVYINNYDHFCPALFKRKTPEECDRRCFRCSSFSYKLQHPISMRYIRWQERAMRNADLIYSDSSYVAMVLERFYSLKSQVFYPLLKLADFKVDRKHAKHITFINPIRTKGAELVLELAKEIGDREFLVVGGKDSLFIKQFKELPNVRYLPWCENMAEVYKDTKILLVPSIWPEPFGRVIPEAQINGIPCIVSNSGGIPEATGKGGIVVGSFRVKDWISAINNMDVDKTYMKYSKEAVLNSRRFSFERQWQRFSKPLSELRLKIDDKKPKKD